MIKKFINFIFILLMINTVYASSIDYFIDSNSLILIGVLLFIFYISYFTINKTMKNSNTATKAILSMSIALFTTWKFQTLNIDITPIMFNLGLGGILESYGPAIILLGLMIAMFIWGFCGIMLIAGMIITFIGYVGQESGILYNGLAMILVGGIMIILGLLCMYRSYIKKIFKNNKYETSSPLRQNGASSPWRPNKNLKQFDDNKPIKKQGEASLDVIIGNKSLKNGRTTLDLSKIDYTSIYIKNGGTGGKLGWRASSHNELLLSGTHGKLSVGKMKKIAIKVRKRNGRQFASVIINGRGGGRLGGRATRGRVMITFKLW